VPAACGAKFANEAGGKHYLKADPSTVQWGYFFENVKPSLVVPSGAEVTVEMITHHAGDDPDKLIKGDKGVFFSPSNVDTPIYLLSGVPDRYES